MSHQKIILLICLAVGVLFVGAEQTVVFGDCGVLDPNVYPNLNNDEIVDFKDFSILAKNWLASGTALEGDFDENQTVDVNDLAYLCHFWLANTCVPTPEEVFQSFKTALRAGNISGAITYVAEITRNDYGEIFQSIEAHLQDYVDGMGSLTLSSQANNMAKYELSHQTGGQTYSFPVVFIRDETGNWKLLKF